MSKLAGEYYLRALGALRGFEGVAMRYANVFGPRQDPKSEAGVVSIFVSRLLGKRPLTVFGDGKQTRDYVFVKDVARANVLASTARCPPTGEFDAPAFNIATSSAAQRARAGRGGGPGHGREARARVRPAAAGRAVPQRARRQQGRSRSSSGPPSGSSRTGCAQLVDWFQKEGT